MKPEKKTNHKKLIIGVVCLCAVVLALSFVVSMLTRPENTKGEETIIGISESDIVENHIYHEYHPSFIVDADITSPGVEKADVLYAKYYQPDEKKVWSSFFNSKLPNADVDEFDGSMSYDGAVNGNGDYMLIGELKGYISGRRDPDYLTVDLATEDFTTKYETWQPSVYPNPSLDTVYTKDSLSFMSPDDAVDYVYSILQNLNISVSKDDVIVYAIDRESMQQVQDSVVEENSGIKKIYRSTFKEKFDEHDEFYILCFTVVQNQIPVTHSEYLYKDTRDLHGSNIKIYLSDSGIFNFDLDYVYQIEGTAETAENLLTVQKALDRAYKENVCGIKMTVDEVRFEYAPVPYNSNYDEVMLKPVWTVHMSGTQVDGYPFCDTIMIDAVTGEKLQ